MIYPYVVQFVLALVASAGFGILFNCPRREVLAGGICGGFAWFFYAWVYVVSMNELLGVFVGSVAVAVLSRIYSYRHMAPSIVFLIPGVIPLVPGALMYKTMKGVLDLNIYDTFIEAVKAIQFAGLIAVAIVIVFSLPYSVFEIGNQKKPKK